MNSPRSLRSPRQVPSSPRATVNAFKVDSINDNPIKIRLPKTIDELLKIATDVLELQRPAKRVYTKNHILIDDISNIEPDADLYFGCYEEKDLSDEPIYKSRLPKQSNATKIVLPPVKQPKPKPQRPDAYQHLAIASSQGTIKKNLRDSFLSLYESLSPEHRLKMECSQQLEKLLQETRQFELADILLLQQIPCGFQNLISFALQAIKGKSIEECRFIATGPSGSGKSSLLGQLVTLFFDKLLIANEARNYLLYVINWRFVNVQTIDQLFAYMVKQFILSIKIARKELITILPILEQWMLSITAKVFPPIPPQISKFPNFPAPAVQILFENLHSKHGNLSEFVSAVANFPRNLSAIFGFKGLVHVYDHFDLCPESATVDGQTVSIIKCFSEVVSSGPFFVSSSTDSDLFKSFTPFQFVDVQTERVIEPEKKNLIIAEPSLTIDIKTCKGCPGYIALFEKVYEKAENQSKTKAGALKTVINDTKSILLRNDFIRLCEVLVDNEELDVSVLAKIMEQQELDIRTH